MKHKLSPFFAILLMALTIPQSVIAYDFSAVAPSGQTLYYSINGNNNTVIVTNYHDPTFTGSKLIIPDTVTYNNVDYVVTDIEEGAFSSIVASVTIPNTVTRIGRRAFYDVRHIEYHGTATGSPWGAWSMNGITDGDYVYSGSTKTHLIAYLGDGENVTIPTTVTIIGSHVFQYCEGLKGYYYNP